MAIILPLWVYLTAMAISAQPLLDSGGVQEGNGPCKRRCGWCLPGRICRCCARWCCRLPCRLFGKLCRCLSRGVSNFIIFLLISALTAALGLSCFLALQRLAHSSAKVEGAFNAASASAVVEFDYSLRLTSEPNRCVVVDKLKEGSKLILRDCHVDLQHQFLFLEDGSVRPRADQALCIGDDATLVACATALSERRSFSFGVSGTVRKWTKSPSRLMCLTSHGMQENLTFAVCASEMQQRFFYGNGEELQPGIQGLAWQLGQEQQALQSEVEGSWPVELFKENFTFKGFILKGFTFDGYRIYNFTVPIPSFTVQEFTIPGTIPGAFIPAIVRRHSSVLGLVVGLSCIRLLVWLRGPKDAGRRCCSRYTMKLTLFMAAALTLVLAFAAAWDALDALIVDHAAVAFGNETHDFSLRPQRDHTNTRCVAASSLEIGAELVLRTCNSGAAEQIVFASDGTVRPYFNQAMCLAASGAARSSSLTFASCPSSASSSSSASLQRFTMQSSGIIKLTSGKWCLNVFHGDLSVGKLELYDCTTGDVNDLFSYGDGPVTTARLLARLEKTAEALEDPYHLGGRFVRANKLLAPAASLPHVRQGALCCAAVVMLLTLLVTMCCRVAAPKTVSAISNDVEAPATSANGSRVVAAAVPAHTRERQHGPAGPLHVRKPVTYAGAQAVKASTLPREAPPATRPPHVPQVPHFSHMPHAPPLLQVPHAPRAAHAPNVGAAHAAAADRAPGGHGAATHLQGGGDLLSEHSNREPPSRPAAPLGAVGSRTQAAAHVRQPAADDISARIAMLRPQVGNESRPSSSRAHAAAHDVAPAVVPALPAKVPSVPRVKDLAANPRSADPGQPHSRSGAGTSRAAAQAGDTGRASQAQVERKPRRSTGSAGMPTNALPSRSWTSLQPALGGAGAGRGASSGTAAVSAGRGRGLGGPAAMSHDSSDGSPSGSPSDSPGGSPADAARPSVRPGARHPPSSASPPWGSVAPPSVSAPRAPRQSRGETTSRPSATNHR